uniref:Uncharacterized protein n=1 Tax=Brassica oleracea TaxID=3712 RepID=A0A3P6AZY7_BRAOL|nr:unnamed protein product [Brassica oleracea]
MSTDNLQTRVDGDISDNIGTTLAVNVSAVNANANTVAFKKMFTTFKKKSEEHEKLIGSLAKHVKTLMARTRAVLPLGATKLRGRRLDFATPPDRPGKTQDNPTAENLDKTTPAVTWKNLENLPPTERETEDNEREQFDLDPSNQSDNSDEDVDVHLRRTRSRVVRHDFSFEKPMTEEEENLFWVEQEKLLEEQARITHNKHRQAQKTADDDSEEIRNLRD